MRATFTRSRSSSAFWSETPICEPRLLSRVTSSLVNSVPVTFSPSSTNPSVSLRQRSGTMSSIPSRRTSSSRSTRRKPSTGSESRKLGSAVDSRVMMSAMLFAVSSEIVSPAPVRTTGPSAVTATR